MFQCSLYQYIESCVASSSPNPSKSTSVMFPTLQLYTHYSYILQILWKKFYNFKFHLYNLCLTQILPYIHSMQLCPNIKGYTMFPFTLLYNNNIIANYIHILGLISTDYLSFEQMSTCHMLYTHKFYLAIMYFSLYN